MKTRNNYALIILFIFTIVPNSISANPYMGGEITWECIQIGQSNAGKYIFQMKLYRNCGMITFGNTMVINSNSPAGNISMTRVNGWTKDLSPICNSDTSFSKITCAGATYFNNDGAIQVFTYRSQPIQLNGTPPASGWMFYWGSCCRNTATNIVIQPSYRLRAIMYPYGNGNMYPCYDNSPSFAEEPQSIICTKDTRSFNYYASDKEFDSLVYEFGEPLLSSGYPITYSSGYSYQNPLPDSNINSNNVAATIDSRTGKAAFTSYTAGDFLTSVKVSAYKCGGIKVAEIWREVHIVLTDCDTNAKPDISLSYISSAPDTIFTYAGDKVCFNIQANSFQFLPNGTPKTVELKVNGTQFGSYIPAYAGNPASMDTITGCVNPPCATLSPAIGQNNPLTGILATQTSFCWQTDCGHLSTNGGCIHHLIDEYRFNFYVKDDFCPVPAHNSISVVIKILPPKPSKIKINSIHYNYTKMTADFSWKKYIDPDTSFIAYDIYHSNNFGGPYTLIDSIQNRNQIVYSHYIGNATKAYYYMQLRAYACNRKSFSENSDTLSIDVTSIENTKKQTQFELFQNEPNPTNGKTVIRYSIDKQAKGKFQLLDFTGRIVFSQYIQSDYGTNEITMETNLFAGGVYYYRIIFGEISRTKTLIILK